MRKEKRRKRETETLPLFKVVCRRKGLGLKELHKGLEYITKWETVTKVKYILKLIKNK